MKQHKKHVRKFHRGRPVKQKTAPRKSPGRSRGELPADPELHGVPPEETKRTMVRSLISEEQTWQQAATQTERGLGLAAGQLTIGPWARRELNAAAKRILSGK